MSLVALHNSMSVGKQPVVFLALRWTMNVCVYVLVKGATFSGIQITAGTIAPLVPLNGEKLTLFRPSPVVPSNAQCACTVKGELVIFPKEQQFVLIINSITSSSPHPSFTLVPAVNNRWLWSHELQSICG